MPDIEAMFQALETTIAPRARDRLREIRAEVGRLLLERDAAREALKLAGAESPLIMVINPTKHLTELEGVNVRIWEGVTAEGIHCHVFVHRVAVGGAADQVRFEAELTEVAGPGQAIDILSFLEGREASRGVVEPG